MILSDILHTTAWDMIVPKSARCNIITASSQILPSLHGTEAQLLLIVSTQLAQLLRGKKKNPLLRSDLKRQKSSRKGKYFMGP